MHTERKGSLINGYHHRLHVFHYHARQMSACMSTYEPVQYKKACLQKKNALFIKPHQPPANNLCPFAHNYEFVEFMWDHMLRICRKCICSLFLNFYCEWNGVGMIHQLAASKTK